MKRTLPLLVLVLILSGLGINPATTHAQELITCDPSIDYRTLYAESGADMAYEEARMTLTCAIRADLNATDLMYALMELDYYNGNPQDLLIYAPAMVRQFPDDPYIALLAAWGYGMTGQTYPCYQMTKRAVNLNFQAPSTSWTGLIVEGARCSFRVGDMFVTSQTAGSLPNPESDAILSLSFTEYSINPEQALSLAQSAYDQANAINFWTEYPTVALSYALKANGRNDEAIAVMNEGVERFQTSYMYAMRAQLYARLYATTDQSSVYFNNYLADAQTAIEMNPTGYWELQVMGMPGTNEPALVRQYGEQIMELYPYNQWHFGMFIALTYSAPEECDTIIRYADRYLSYYPENESALYYKNDPEWCGSVTSQLPVFECDPTMDFEATIAELNGDWVKILPVAQCWVESQPENLVAYTTLGDTYWYLGDSENSLAVYEQVIQIAPEDFYLISVLADSYFYTGDIITCLQRVDVALEIDPQYYYGQEVAMRCSYALGDYARVIETGTIWHDLYPDYTGTLFELADSYRLVGDCENALAIAEVGRNLLPDDTRFADVQTQCGGVTQAPTFECDPNTDFATIVADLNGDWAQILPVAQCWVDSQPDNAEAYATLGDAYWYVDNYEKAIETYQAGLVLFPTDVYLLASLGDAYSAIGNPEMCLEKANAALAIEPQDDYATNVVMWCAYTLGDYARVIEVGAPRHELYPDYTTGLFELADSYRLVGDCENALAIVEAAQTLAPDDTRFADVQTQCGGVTQAPTFECDPNTDFATIVADLNGDWAQIIPVAQCWVDSQPDNAEAYATLGYAYLYMGDYENALLAYQAGVEQFPTDVYLLTSTADAYWGMGNDELCLENVTVALEVDPQYAYAQEIAMHCLYNLGDYARVIEIGVTWHDLYPDYATGLFDLADSYRLVGDCENALAIVEDAKILLPDDTRFADIEAQCGG